MGECPNCVGTCVGLVLEKRGKGRFRGTLTLCLYSMVFGWLGIDLFAEDSWVVGKSIDLVGKGNCDPGVDPKGLKLLSFVVLKTCRNYVAK